ncbi:hypothetical protein [Salisaeta longa]|uniref:hypothetical protein n=1 Tax=Salisaeta longa TaxID=503170 RepID=UPI0012F74B4D|nr:hypothetical protein [Salisaeta longa]
MPRFLSRMRTLICLAAMLFVAGACNGTPDPEHIDVSTPGVQQVLVFVDASASAGNVSTLPSVYRDSLRAVIKKRLTEPRDRISIFPVHAKTTSKVGRWDMRNTVRRPKWSSFAQDRRSRKLMYESKVQSFLKRAQEQAVRHARALYTDRNFEQWTDLWGTLQVISEEAQPKKGPVRVYYFSDMFESVPGAKRRNFERVPPTNKAQAQRWAARDAERIKQQLSLQPSVLRNVKVRVLPGPLAAKDHALAVKMYWMRLFEALGMQATYN